MNTYILAFGAHPDDVEVGAWWILAKASVDWKRTVIIDLTTSQLSTYWTETIRMQESQTSAQILGVAERINLRLQDWSLQTDDLTIAQVVEQIRMQKPEIVTFPWHTDRHPDHEMTHQIVKKALFFAWLQNYPWSTLPTRKPRLTLCYQIWHELTPDVVIPLTDDQFEKKMLAFAAYISQEETNGWGVDYLRARHLTQWRRIGTHYGEWFLLPCHGVGVTDLDHLISGCF